MNFLFIKVPLMEQPVHSSVANALDILWDP